MNVERVEAIARAVLYEGYALHPHRASRISESRRRWAVGAVFPRAWTAAHEDDFSEIETQVLVHNRRGHKVEGAKIDAAKVEAHVHFLHLVRRQVGAIDPPLASLPADGEPAMKLVPDLRIDGAQFTSLDEAVDKEVAPPACSLFELTRRPMQFPFKFRGRRDLTALKNVEGAISGLLCRTSRTLIGSLTLAAEEVQKGVYRVSARIRNLSRMLDNGEFTRETALLSAFVSAHTILTVEGAEFVSLLDPPDNLADAASTCANIGTWPVLAGEEGEKDTVLSSPIILYDYPETLPESVGHVYGGAEIDKLLTLSLLVQTDDRKRELARLNPRARALIERTESLTPEQIEMLHGAFRLPRPARAELALIRVSGLVFKLGDRVRVRPKAHGDKLHGDPANLMPDNQVGVIEAIERDNDGRVHIAVVLDKSPALSHGLRRRVGCRFFFSPNELEAISGEMRK